MQRVMIVGGSGSGKSTLARALGARTGLPVHHMDHIHWQPGWQARPRDLRRDMALEVENGAAWVFEGGFSTTYAHRLSRADTLIWLDLPVSLRLWRVTKRLLRHWGQNRPDMAPGCVEGIHGETWAFYRWIWDTRHSGRARIVELLDTAPPELRVHHLTSTSAVRRFLEASPC
ncbi:AAA family ATPase [uncultured Tateyamaria sp.]|uniref:AAA family ATPase n=1 Tax=uncultured Tateyamaria sp. TaxID=455651 RepID=UPI0026226AD9|nr:AAA family ATPase [uncultured Tateyamaria sp.]